MLFQRQSHKRYLRKQNKCRSLEQSDKKTHDIIPSQGPSMSLPHHHIPLVHSVVRASISEPETRSTQERAMGFLHMKIEILCMLHLVQKKKKKKLFTASGEPKWQHEGRSDEGLKCGTYILGCYSLVKRKDHPACGSPWRKLEGMTLSEVNQPHRMIMDPLAPCLSGPIIFKFTETESWMVALRG